MTREKKHQTQYLPQWGCYEDANMKHRNTWTSTPNMTCITHMFENRLKRVRAQLHFASQETKYCITLAAVAHTTRFGCATWIVEALWLHVLRSRKGKLSNFLNRLLKRNRSDGKIHRQPTTTFDSVAIKPLSHCIALNGSYEDKTDLNWCWWLFNGQRDAQTLSVGRLRFGLRALPVNLWHGRKTIAIYSASGDWNVQRRPCNRKPTSKPKEFVSNISHECHELLENRKTKKLLK